MNWLLTPLATLLAATLLAAVTALPELDFVLQENGPGRRDRQHAGRLPAAPQSGL